MGNALEIRGLTKLFGDNKVVDGLDLAVADGEVVALLGPSGCGKTTTLRCIAGLERPSSGEIVIAGKTVFSSEKRTVVAPEKRGVGLVFQSYALWPHLSVAQNVAYGLKVQGRGKAEIAALTTDILKSVGLGAFGDRHPGTLSGGQQQRVALARSLVTEPRVLLFDEPLSNLDAKMRENMRHELTEVIKRVGLTAVYVTHDQTEAMSMTDRVVLLKDGLIEQQDTPRAIYRRPRTRFAAEFIGSANVVSGSVTAIEEEEVHVQLTPQVEVSAARDDWTGGIGDQVLVAVRPERIQLGAAPGDANSFDAVVRTVEFLGGHTVYYLATDDMALRAQSPNSEMEEGETVRVRLAPRDLHLVLENPVAGQTANSKSLPTLPSADDTIGARPERGRKAVGLSTKEAVPTGTTTELGAK